MQKSHAPRLRKGELEAMLPEAQKAHLKAQAKRYYNLRYKRRFPRTEGDNKQCRKCLQLKPRTLEHFLGSKQVKDGLSSWCRECTNQRGRDDRVRKEYGITRAEYDAAIVGARCYICHTERRLVLDHCHNMGTPRGVLCANCNTGLGMFCDDPERIDAAAAYLRASRR